MKDQRVTYFRGVLDKLVESLDATVRIARWTDADAVPDPLRASAGLLLERLGTANRLASDKFVGSPVVLKAMTAMASAIHQLDGAFVEYRTTVEGSDTEKTEGAIALEAVIANVRDDAKTWEWSR